VSRVEGLETAVIRFVPLPLPLPRL